MARIQYRGLYAYITLWTAASAILPQKGDAGQRSGIAPSWPAGPPMKTAASGNLGHLFAQAVVCSVLAACTNACFRPGAYMLGLADIRKLRVRRLRRISCVAPQGTIKVCRVKQCTLLHACWDALPWHLLLREFEKRLRCMPLQEYTFLLGEL